LDCQHAISFSVSGSRKVAAFLFRGRRRVRICDVEVEDDDDEDDYEDALATSALSSSELNTSQ